MSDKINKAYEVALACAAQDGLSPPELMSMVDSIKSVPLLAPVLQTMFEATGVEGDEINPIEAIEALSQLMEIIDNLELTTIDDAYMEDATSVMGESAAINNLCAAMCLLFSASDGEISKMEGAGIQKVLEHLTNADPDIFQPLVTKIAQGIDLG